MKIFVARARPIIRYSKPSVDLPLKHYRPIHIEKHNLMINKMEKFGFTVFICIYHCENL